MARLSHRQRVQAEGRRAAIKEHVRLDCDRTAPIDVFGIIERERLWLFFEPLPRLLGLYDRAGDAAPGILINSKHPLALQRFTAAHEYGHHVLGHEASTDDESTIVRVDDPNADQEIAAQAFAAEFLMPQKLVNHTLRRLNLPRTRDALDPGQAYRISVELGASFSATVYQLRTLKFLSPARANDILDARPIDIKAELLGERPEDLGSIDVWSIHAEQAGQTFFPRVGDRVRIELPETPSTGYRWAIDPAGPMPSGLTLVGDRFEHAAGDRIGGAGVRSFTLSVIEPGKHHLRVGRSRPWERENAAIESFAIDLVTYAGRTGDAERGPTPYQRECLLASGF